MAAGDPIDWADFQGPLASYVTGKPICRLLQAATQSIPNNTLTALTFGSGSEDIDTNSFHDPSTNNTRITPNVAGYYDFRMTLVMGAPASGNFSNLEALFKKNGIATTVPPGAHLQTTFGTTAGASQGTVCGVFSMNGTTDYMEMTALQQTSGAIAVSTSVSGGLTSVFECILIRPL